jgi:hypothetical protein
VKNKINILTFVVLSVLSTTHVLSAKNPKVAEFKTDFNNILSKSNELKKLECELQSKYYTDVVGRNRKQKEIDQKKEEVTNLGQQLITKWTGIIATEDTARLGAKASKDVVKEKTQEAIVEQYDSYSWALNKIYRNAVLSN